MFMAHAQLDHGSGLDAYRMFKVFPHEVLLLEYIACCD